jgi:multiple sugar transport system permease protein
MNNTIKVRGRVFLREGTISRFRLGKKRQQMVGYFIAYTILTVAALLVLLPLVWTFLASLKDKVLVYQIPPAWIFKPTFENYLALLVKYPFPSYFINSALVASVTTVLAIIFGALAAYSISRFNTGGTFLQGFVLNSYTMPRVAVLIPIFMLMQTLGLIDTYPALIVAYLSFLLPFTIWMLIGYFDGVARDMEEAALVDGATKMQALRYVVFPLAAPGVAATGILSFLFSWNEFMFALIITGNDTRTLPIAVANFLTHRGVAMGELSAATMVMIIPVMILAFSIRNYLVSGLSLGAVK